MPCKVEIKKDRGCYSVKINGEDMAMNCKSLKLEIYADRPSKITLELIVDTLEIDDTFDELEINNKLIGVEPINNRHEILDL